MNHGAPDIFHRENQAFAGCSITFSFCVQQLLLLLKMMSVCQGNKGCSWHMIDRTSTSAENDVSMSSQQRTLMAHD